MLTAYITRTQQLLQNPPADTDLYTTSDLTQFINSARGQMAGETECIRRYGTLAATAGTQVYAFSSIVPGTTDVSGIFNIRGATVSIASGQVWMQPRSFPYFQLYYLNNPVPQQGVPAVYSQFGQGIAGTLYLAPVPDLDYTLNLDVVANPIDLVDNMTAEAIPYPYTDAVPYYAAYLALLSAQRTTQAGSMWEEYQRFAARARIISNGAVNPGQYPQQRNPVRVGQLGLQAMQQPGGGNA